MAAGFRIATAYVEIKTDVDEADVKKDVKAVAEKAQAELDKNRPSTSIDLVNWKEVDKLLDKLSAVPMALAKFSALGGVGAAVAQVAAGLVAFSSSIGLASLSISAVIPAAVGLGGVFGVMKLLLMDMESGVMKRFAVTLDLMKERLRQVAVAAATPGLKVFLEGIVALGPLAELYVHRIAQAIGVAAKETGELAKSPLFRARLGELLDDAATGVFHLAAAMAPLIDTIVTLGAAAGPTFTRFTFWIENLVKKWQEWVNLKYATGELQALLKESADEAAKLGKILWNFFSGIVGLLRGAKGPALEFSSAVLEISESFKAWAWKPETQEKVAKFVEFLLKIDVGEFFKLALAFAAIGKSLEAFSGLAGMGEGIGALVKLGPVGAIVTAVAVGLAILVGGLVAAYFASERFREAIGNAFTWVNDNVVPILKDMYHWIAERFGPAVDQAVNEALPGFQDALRVLQGIWTDNEADILAFIDKLKILIGWMIDPGIPIIGQFVGALALLVGVGIGAAIIAVHALNSVLDGFYLALQVLWDIVKNVAAGLVTAWNWIWEAGVTAWNGLLAVIQFVVNAIVAGWNWLWETLQPVFGAIGTAIDFIGATVRFLWEVIQPILTLIGIGFEMMKLAILSAIGVAMMAIQWLWEKVQFCWDVIQNVLTAIGTAWQWVSDRISGIINWIITKLGELMSWFSDMRNRATETTDGVESAWNGMWNTVSDIVNRIKDILSTMWNSLTEGVGRAVDGAKDKIRELLGTALDISRRVNDVFNSIRNTISNLNPLGFAHGGIVGAASGGIRGGVHMVGEHGPEMVRLPAGSRVRSNPDTERLLNQSSGGGQGGGQLEVVFGGNTSDAFASAFMLLVRQGKIQLTARA